MIPNRMLVPVRISRGSSYRDFAAEIMGKYGFIQTPYVGWFSLFYKEETQTEEREAPTPRIEPILVKLQLQLKQVADWKSSLSAIGSPALIQLEQIIKQTVNHYEKYAAPTGQSKLAGRRQDTPQIRLLEHRIGRKFNQELAQKREGRSSLIRQTVRVQHLIGEHDEMLQVNAGRVTAENSTVVQKPMAASAVQRVSIVESVRSRLTSAYETLQVRKFDLASWKMELDSANQPLAAMKLKRQQKEMRFARGGYDLALKHTFIPSNNSEQNAELRATKQVVTRQVEERIVVRTEHESLTKKAITLLTELKLPEGKSSGSLVKRLIDEPGSKQIRTIELDWPLQASTGVRVLKQQENQKYVQLGTETAAMARRTVRSNPVNQIVIPLSWVSNVFRQSMHEHKSVIRFSEARFVHYNEFLEQVQPIINLPDTISLSRTIATSNVFGHKDLGSVFAHGLTRMIWMDRVNARPEVRSLADRDANTTPSRLVDTRLLGQQTLSSRDYAGTKRQTSPLPSAPHAIGRTASHLDTVQIVKRLANDEIVLRREQRSVVDKPYVRLLRLDRIQASAAEQRPNHSQAAHQQLSSSSHAAHHLKIIKLTQIRSGERIISLRHQMNVLEPGFSQLIWANVFSTLSSYLNVSSVNQVPAVYRRLQPSLIYGRQFIQRNDNNIDMSLFNRAPSAPEKFRAANKHHKGTRLYLHQLTNRDQPDQLHINKATTLHKTNAAYTWIELHKRLEGIRTPERSSFNHFIIKNNRLLVSVPASLARAELPVLQMASKLVDRKLQHTNMYSEMQPLSKEINREKTTKPMTALIPIQVHQSTVHLAKNVNIDRTAQLDNRLRSVSNRIGSRSQMPGLGSNTMKRANTIFGGLQAARPGRFEQRQAPAEQTEPKRLTVTALSLRATAAMMPANSENNPNGRSIGIFLNTNNRFQQTFINRPIDVNRTGTRTSRSVLLNRFVHTHMTVSNKVLGHPENANRIQGSNRLYRMLKPKSLTPELRTNSTPLRYVPGRVQAQLDELLITRRNSPGSFKPIAVSSNTDHPKEGGHSSIKQMLSRWQQPPATMHYYKQSPAPVQEEQKLQKPIAANSLPPEVQIVPQTIRQLSEIPKKEMDKLVERIYKEIENKLVLERQRRGL